MDPWVQAEAAAREDRVERALEALVAVSTPSGDAQAAEEAGAIAAALLPDAAQVERVPCSSPDHAPDLVARLRGTGSGRVLLLGHLDTVVPHAAHRPLKREGGHLVGSGTVDMKGGDVLAIAVMHALGGVPDTFAEVALLLVCDEEWRVGDFAHVERFAGFDACLCFEAGQHDSDGHDAVVVERKGAGTIEIVATGRAAHSGSAPDQGANALLALASAAQAVAACHDPDGPDRLTAVPTVVRSGDAFNVVPAEGRLVCDVRASSLDAFDRVVEAVPAEVGGAALDTGLVRRWPAMNSREATAGLLAAAGERLGRPIVAGSRGGASDASHFAATIPWTIDGLGPCGGGAHAPHEFVVAASLRERLEVALALAATVLDGT